LKGEGMFNTSAGQVLWMLLFFLFIFLYPRYMLFKIIAEIEAVAEKLEGYTRRAVNITASVCKEKGKVKEDPKKIIENALELFLIPPVDLDPYGILKKIEHLLDKVEEKLESIAQTIAPESDEIWRANIVSLLKGGIGLNTIAKLVRHYVEFIKKTNNLQIAMLVQMNLPMIKKLAKAQMEGVKAISEGKPIGDSIGPLVAANLIRGETYEIAKDVVCHETEIEKRKVYVLKAHGPGANLGKLGNAVKKICKGREIAKIITIDASVKLEGEKSGKVSEGIGAAIGDPGPEKAKIEEAAVERNIPLEAIAIKMSVEEAISPLTKNIADSVPEVIEKIKHSILMAPEGKGVVVVGVGNSCGIADTYEEVKKLKLPEPKKEEKKEPIVDRILKAMVGKPRLKEE